MSASFSLRMCVAAVAHSWGLAVAWGVFTRASNCMSVRRETLTGGVVFRSDVGEFLFEDVRGGGGPLVGVGGGVGRVHPGEQLHERTPRDLDGRGRVPIGCRRVSL